MDMRLFRKRRAQVTIFLIIGVVLLFSTAILFYIRDKTAEAPAEFKPVIEEVPLEAQPAKLFVEGCINRVTKRVLILLGAQGGYINMSDKTLSGTTFEIGFKPTESDAIRLFEDLDSFIPYWWYMASEDDCAEGCTFNSKRPELLKTYGPNSIEAQVDEYVKRNLKDCLGDYAPLKAQGFKIEEIEELKVDFRVAENDVAILVERPMIITKTGRDIKIRDFFVKFDLPLKRLYSLAREITDDEIHAHFLEWQVMNSISANSYPLGLDRLPPIAEVTLGYDDYYIWSRTETQQRMEQFVIPQAMAMLLRVNTRNYVHRNVFTDGGKVDNVVTGVLDTMSIVPNSTNNYPDISANFAYVDWWPIYLNINDEEILKPMSLINENIPIPFNPKTYYFLYDVSFPALVILQSPEAFNGEGYRFIFALEGNIRHNAVMNTSYVGRFTTIDIGPIMCKPQQRKSGLVNITLKDKFTGEPVLGARIDMKYGNNYCFMGFTELNDEGEAVLSMQFPVGAGEIKINKEGYAPIATGFMALKNISFVSEFDMYPERMMKAWVRTKRLHFLPGTGGTFGLPRPDDPDAEGSVLSGKMVIIRLKRIDDDAFKGYSTTLAYNPSRGTHTEFLVVPGKYEVKGEYINQKDELIFEAKDLVYEVPFQDDVVIHFNETRMENWLEGGIELNEGYYIEIPPEPILTNKTATFFVLSFPRPMEISRIFGDVVDIALTLKHKEYSQLYSEYLQPRFN